MLRFSPHAGALAQSETLAITATAKRMAAAGTHVIPFAAGEPDFDTPGPIREAGIAAIREGRTRYGPAAGIQPLREAVAAHLGGHGLDGLAAEDTIIGPGAKGVLYLALSALLEVGDEVVVPTPCWLSYPKMVQALGGTVVPVPTSAGDGFVIDPDAVAAAITPRTKAIILNSPGNPTGAVQPVDALAAIGRVAAARGVAVVSDEIYEHLVYPPETFTSFAAAAPEARDVTLLVNGVSKAYAMTGWRIGYAGGPTEWVARMVRLQSHALSGPTEIAQRAALAALEGGDLGIAERRTAFQARRDAMLEAFEGIDGLTAPRPDGAFYVLADVTRWIGRTHEGTAIDDSVVLARLLLEHAHVAVVPGDVFLAPGTIRLSYACGLDDVREGVRRIGGFLAALA